MNDSEQEVYLAIKDKNLLWTPCIKCDIFWTLEQRREGEAIKGRGDNELGGNINGRGSAVFLGGRRTEMQRRPLSA